MKPGDGGRAPGKNRGTYDTELFWVVGAILLLLLLLLLLELHWPLWLRGMLPRLLPNDES